VSFGADLPLSPPPFSLLRQDSLGDLPSIAGAVENDNDNGDDEGRTGGLHRVSGLVRSDSFGEVAPKSTTPAVSFSLPSSSSSSSTSRLPPEPLSVDETLRDAATATAAGEGGEGEGEGANDAAISSLQAQLAAALEGQRRAEARASAAERGAKAAATEAGERVMAAATAVSVKERKSIRGNSRNIVQKEKKLLWRDFMALLPAHSMA